MTIYKHKYLLYLVLWLFIATILLLSNSISLFLSNTSGVFIETIIYHFAASTIWILVAKLLSKIYSHYNLYSFKWLLISYSIFPLITGLDALFRCFLRYLIIGAQFDANNFFNLLFILLDTNFLIYSCITFFVFYSYRNLFENNLALKNAKVKMYKTKGEYDQIMTIIPPRFFARNIQRIIRSFEKSYLDGEDLIAKFGDFLRVIIYENKKSSDQKEQYFELFKKTYEDYISTYLHQDIQIMISEIDEIYKIDEEIEKDETQFTIYQ